MLERESEREKTTEECLRDGEGEGKGKRDRQKEREREREIFAS
jgi:hypothetical protein